MKSTVTAATALALALAATTASAGVVISQQMVNSQADQRKIDQTVMIQGHKQKVITGDNEELITDLDAGKFYLLKPKDKHFIEGEFPPVGPFAMRMIWQGSTIELKKTGGTHQAAGYACQDYAGSAIIAHRSLNLTKCVAGDAPGAKEFVEFQKVMADKLKGTRIAPKGQLPDGIPVSSVMINGQPPFTPSSRFPAAAGKELQKAIAKYKPVTIETTVSKIEVKDIPAAAFVPPADYTKGVAPSGMPHIMQMHEGHPVTPGAAPATPPAAAAPAAPAPH